MRRSNISPRAVPSPGRGLVADEGTDEASPSDARRRRLGSNRDSLAPTYLGIMVVMLGLALVALAWGLVASETRVVDQVPPLVAAGFTGMALVLCGVVVVDIAARRQDAAERARQIAELADLLRELQDGLTDAVKP